ncbi:unnamed protein product [Adineta steineri]|uniref:Uncharacterized protein n=1 Tax=Adineta steineri TaxID=433720 RepID=A0A814YP52_9BILA|nr:unnamed protein product [Adineta steineri]
MWSRQLFLVGIFTLTILTTQSHVIHKRGVFKKMFGGDKQSTRDVEADMTPKERSKYRELLKNPIVISMLSAAVGMVVQQALAAKNMNDVCDNKYIKMAYMAGNINPQIQQALNLLGCNGPNRKSGGNNNSKDKYGAATTPASKKNGDDDDEEAGDAEDENQEDTDNLESRVPPEKESKLKELLNVARGEKGAKTKLIKSFFGFGKKDSTIKSGHKIPQSSYKLDKDDANAMKNFNNELDQHDKKF